MTEVSEKSPQGKKLSTAEIRRESVIVAAIPVFAEKGYHAAPTLSLIHI